MNKKEFKRMEKLFEVLFNAWDWCDENDKSTEFTIQYMADISESEPEDIAEFMADPEVNLLRSKRHLTNP